MKHDADQPGPPSPPPERPDPAHRPDRAVERAIGRQVRDYRRRLDLTVADLARLAGLSGGMLSRIETGQASPSLATLKSLAGALNVPVTALFRKLEEQRDAVHVPAGAGLVIERRGSRAGHIYHLLGHSIGRSVQMEPYLVTLTEESEVFPLFQHDGVEFIHVLQGRVVYRHADRTYPLGPGDSLFFDGDAPHGPEILEELPVRLLSVIGMPRPDIA